MAPPCRLIHKLGAISSFPLIGARLGASLSHWRPDSYFSFYRSCQTNEDPTTIPLQKWVFISWQRFQKENVLMADPWKGLEDTSIPMAATPIFSS